MEDCSSLFWTVCKTGRPSPGAVFLNGFFKSRPTCNLICSRLKLTLKTLFFYPRGSFVGYGGAELVFCSKIFRQDVFFVFFLLSSMTNGAFFFPPFFFKGTLTPGSAVALV